MISLDDFKRIAKLKGIKNIGHAEKDYLIEIILLSISKHTKDELVFKGGTCLYKFYKLNRFSEDIDFTLVKEIDLDGLLKRILLDLDSFGIKAEIKEKKEVFNSTLITLRLEGLLYRGNPQSTSNIGFDINKKSSIDMKPTPATYNSIYPDIPEFSLLVMQEKEILAEKIRAISSRKKARDVYDLWFLVNKGIKFDLDFVSKKLEYYKQNWDLKDFEKKIDEKKSIWETELKPLIQNVPDFETVKKDVLKALR